jgi:hypothetical protein
MDLIFPVCLPPFDCEAALLVGRGELEEDVLDWKWGSALLFDMLVPAGDTLIGVIMFLVDIDP